MTVQLSPEQQLKFSNIMYLNDGRQMQQIQNLNPLERSKLKSVYAQKIAYQAANASLKQTQQPVPVSNNTGGILSTICCCFSPSQNSHNFDITTPIFLKRIFSTILFCRSDFLTIGQKPQLYGFLWLTITYIIILGIAANLNEYFIMPFNYQFRNDLMLRAIGVSVLFLVSAPFIYKGVVQCLKGAIDITQSMMISGYSTTLLFIPTILCLIPSLYWHVGMLCIGSILRAVFLFRNYSTKIPQKSFVILVVALIIEGLFVLTLLKLLFPNDNGYNITDGTSRVFKNSHFMVRSFIDSN